MDWEAYRLAGQNAFNASGRIPMPEQLVSILVALYAQENLGHFIDWLKAHGKDASDFEFGGIAHWLSLQNQAHQSWLELLKPGVLPAPVPTVGKHYPQTPIPVRKEIMEFGK